MTKQHEGFKKVGQIMQRIQELEPLERELFEKAYNAYFREGTPIGTGIE